MSGAEIGLVLAIIPLCIAAVEHYDVVLKPFKRYRNYAIEIQRFQDELASQQIIFESELEILLSYVTSSEVAEAMVQDCRHPSWEQCKIEEKLASWLGKSHSACINTIRLICEDLSNIAKEASFFDIDTKESAIPLQALEKEKDSYKERIGRKLRWSLSRSKLQQRLQDLQYHVEVFRRHTGQASSIKSKRQKMEPTHQANILRTHTIVEAQIVQVAAIELYQALKLACNLHQRHELHFRLETGDYSSGEASLVRFKLGLILEFSSTAASPIWITIETKHSVTKMVMSNLTSTGETNARLLLHNVLKRTPDVLITDSQRKKKRMPGGNSARFEEPKPLTSCSLSANPAASCSNKVISTSETSTGREHDYSRVCQATCSSVENITPQDVLLDILPASLPDFCLQQDICIQIAQHSKTDCRTKDSCIGYLGKQGTNSRRVLLAPLENKNRSHPVTLDNLVSSSVTRTRSRRFLYLDSIRLAKQLASAILHYHGTPMLNENWQSKDVILYETRSAAETGRPNLANPHLSVLMLDGHSHDSLPDLNYPRSSIPRDRQIRNLYTYRLGVILLELACQAPLSKLWEEEVAIVGRESLNTEFEAAKLISETVCTDMGIPFQKIVQKCLNCDFGCGSDLNDPNLQAAFHNSVVKELEGIESRLNALHLVC